MEKIDIVKGLLSKSKEKFICPDGHVSDVEETFCSTCRKNIKGLTEYQLTEIVSFAEKVEILRDMLKKDKIYASNREPSARMKL